LTDDIKSNRSAARRFNTDVRICVENSDPDAVRAILHDRHNHKFALDAAVLETVMKAYVMAVMFDDALYFLRNCALPATLSTTQTERILTRLVLLANSAQLCLRRFCNPYRNHIGTIGANKNVYHKWHHVIHVELATTSAIE
jgi:hypothetical protein